MDDADLAAISAKCLHDFSAVKNRLGLGHYAEHIMEGGSVEVATYRYDLGQRFLFIEVDNQTSLVRRAFFAPKTSAQAGLILAPNRNGRIGMGTQE